MEFALISYGNQSASKFNKASPDGCHVFILVLRAVRLYRGISND